MTRRKLSVHVALTLLTTTTVILLAQQRPLKSAYDPGIRPVTPESIQAEKAAEDAWFARLQVLAGRRGAGFLGLELAARQNLHGRRLKRKGIF